MRFLASLVWPFAVLDRYLTNRRIDAAKREHAADMARIEACGRGTCCRGTLADDIGHR